MNFDSNGVKFNCKLKVMFVRHELLKVWIWFKGVWLHGRESTYIGWGRVPQLPREKPKSKSDLKQWKRSDHDMILILENRRSYSKAVGGPITTNSYFNIQTFVYISIYICFSFSLLLSTCDIDMIRPPHACRHPWMPHHMLNPILYFNQSPTI